MTGSEKKKKQHLEAQFAGFVGAKAEDVEISFHVHRCDGTVAHVLEIEGDACVGVREWLARGGREACLSTGIRVSAPDFDAECDSTLVLLKNADTDDEEVSWAAERQRARGAA